MRIKATIQYFSLQVKCSDAIPRCNLHDLFNDLRPVALTATTGHDIYAAQPMFLVGKCLHQLMVFKLGRRNYFVVAGCEENERDLVAYVLSNHPPTGDPTRRSTT